MKTKINKAQLQIQYLAIAVILLVFLAFMLAVVMPRYIKWWRTGEEEAECTLSIWMGAMKQYSSLGILSLPPQCKARNVVVDKAKLSEYQAKAKSKIAKYKANDYERILEKFNNPKDEKQVNELALDLLVSDELVSCWKKVLRGKLPMFDKNYNVLDLTLFGAFEGDYSEREKQFVQSSNVGFFEVWGPPSACIICSHIRLTEDIQKLGLPDVIESGNLVLEHTPGPKGFPKSAYEYLEEGQYFPPTSFFSPNEKHIAVVYLRRNMHLIDEVLGILKPKYLLPTYWLNLKTYPEGEVQDQNLVVLFPFNKVQKPISKEEGGLGCLKVVQ
ncbi:hypothetical protein HYV79_04920 [Candidatus Woesearchaeota archaeon]|nr:hypothetical protein [Candidatus Woesearchaeota archaeon]